LEKFDQVKAMRLTASSFGLDLKISHTKNVYLLLCKQTKRHTFAFFKKFK